MTHPYSEDTLVERPAIALFGQLGWETANCFDEVFGVVGRDVPPERLYGDAATAGLGHPYLGRETPAEVVLRPRLAAALARLNPDLPPEALALAVEELCRDRSALSPVEANREIYDLLRDGVKVTAALALQGRGAGGEGDSEDIITVRVIDWDHPDSNDFFLASQFWISGEIYTAPRRPGGLRQRPAAGLRRAEGVAQAAGERLPRQPARLQDRHPAALLVQRPHHPLQRQRTARSAAVTAGGSTSPSGRRSTAKGEQGVVSLETMLRGTCEPGAAAGPGRELHPVRGGAQGGTDQAGRQEPPVPGRQQCLRRRRSCIAATESRQGRLGVFWHTQGSGKSYSMIFFAQKVLRKLPGNWTFVVVTDRQELDEQIYKNFASVGRGHRAGGARPRRAAASTCSQLLREDHRYVFTLIQKFRTERGRDLPGALRPVRHHRHDRRGAPQPVRHLRR